MKDIINWKTDYKNNDAVDTVLKMKACCRERRINSDRVILFYKAGRNL